MSKELKTMLIGFIIQSVIMGAWMFGANRVSAERNLETRILKLELSNKALVETLTENKSLQDDAKKESKDDAGAWQSELSKELKSINENISALATSMEVTKHRTMELENRITTLDRRFNRHINQRDHFSSAEQQSVH